MGFIGLQDGTRIHTSQLPTLNNGGTNLCRVLKNNCVSSAHKKELPLEQYKAKINLRMVKREELEKLRNPAYKLLIP